MRPNEVVFRMTLYLILLFFTNFYNVLAQNYQRTDQSIAMTKWPSDIGYPTWHFDTDMSEKPLTKWEELGAVANAHWNWVIQQDGARGGGGICLVASLWDPISKTIFSSTIPKGTQKASMRASGPSFAPAWWAQVKDMLPRDYFHAEDACYYNYESAHQSQVQNGIYSTGNRDGGMWIVVYGSFSQTDTRGRFVQLCGSNPRRNPSCRQVANALGIYEVDTAIPSSLLVQDQETDDSAYDDPVAEALIAQIKEGYCDRSVPTKSVRGSSKARRNNTGSLLPSVACPISLSGPDTSPAASITLEYLSSFSGNSTEMAPTTLSTTSTASTSSSSPAVTQFSCYMQDPEPSEGENSAVCVCEDSKTTISAPLLSIPSSEFTIYSQSCEYSTWPEATTTMTNALGEATTNTRLCQVCTPYAINEDSCQTIPGCIPQVAAASVTVGSKPVHVGTLTGTDLYTSVSDALVSLCPTPSQTSSATQCDETGSVSIGGIEYVDQDSLQTGSLVVQIPTSGYNDSTILMAMINSIAMSIQNSATSTSGNNCFTVHYEIEELKRRGLGFWDLYSSAMNRLGLRDGDLNSRDHPIPMRQHKTMCNAAWFHTAEYYNPFWRTARDPGPTDYINAEVSFHASNNDDFLCSFLDALVDGLALVAPEFIVADVELEEGINALCCLADGTCSSG